MTNLQVPNPTIDWLREFMEEQPMYKDVDLPRSDSGIVNLFLDDLRKSVHLIETINGQYNVYPKTAD